ncbi:MAG: glycerol-3-phosphate dehydrogenase/oxidase [Bdellovibrionaceae bacterium]|nr:glycerol-3-phosphate dehydrogenase/oxidase [Pseudobdellovibrionaceae bacterium]
MFSKYTRQNILSSVADETYDLLIVGGGITGAGVARDAASRGMKVLLCEAQDFASGTSSRSSKLVHGGIRYLENLEFGLVHEALTERTLLLEIAPHMVHPLRFLLPVYKNSRVGLLKMELGMILYDLLSFFEAPKLHEFHLSQGTQSAEPLLQSNELVGSVVYSDAYMEDDRLVIETLRAAHTLGAGCVNYTSVDKVVETASGIEAQITDAIQKKSYTVKAKHVVCALGPWTDLSGQELIKDWKSVLRPTKGVHLVFSRERIPVQRGIVMAVEERIVFVIPRGDIVIVGTTDTDFKGDPGQVFVDKSDVTYLLEITNKYFPTLSLKPEDVISCYAGVRPLVRDDSSSEGKTSREHVIYKHTDNVTLVAGGKYTTYRSMAEEIVDTVLSRFSFEQKMSFRSPNTKTALNPMATTEKIRRISAQVDSYAGKFGVSASDVMQLVGRHGEEAIEILETMSLFKGEPRESALWKAEAKFSFDQEMCFRIEDFYWRRSPLFLTKPDNGLSVLTALAEYFGTLNREDRESTKANVQKVVDKISLEKRAISELFAAR